MMTDKMEGNKNFINFYNEENPLFELFEFNLNFRIKINAEGTYNKTRQGKILEHSSEEFYHMGGQVIVQPKHMDELVMEEDYPDNRNYLNVGYSLFKSIRKKEKSFDLTDVRLKDLVMKYSPQMYIRGYLNFHTKNNLLEEITCDDIFKIFEKTAEYQFKRVSKAYKTFAEAYYGKDSYALDMIK